MTVLDLISHLTEQDPNDLVFFVEGEHKYEIGYVWQSQQRDVILAPYDTAIHYPCDRPKHTTHLQTYTTPDYHKDIGNG